MGGRAAGRPDRPAGPAGPAGRRSAFGRAFCGQISFRSRFPRPNQLSVELSTVKSAFGRASHSQISFRSNSMWSIQLSVELSVVKSAFGRGHPLTGGWVKSEGGRKPIKTYVFYPPPPTTAPPPAMGGALPGPFHTDLISSIDWKQRGGCLMHVGCAESRGG